MFLQASLIYMAGLLILFAGANIAYSILNKEEE